MASGNVVLTEIHDRIGVIRINRPEQLNALNKDVLRRMIKAALEFDDNPDVGALVITGNERSFAAGVDIKEMTHISMVEVLLSDHLILMDRLRDVKKPIIAAVSGWALGGGCELAMACDMIIASETAQFGQPEINIGVIPGAGGTQRLTRAVGKVIAMEMVLNGRFLTAKEAAQFGLVNRVVPVETYLQSALDLASQIAGRAPIAMRLAKEAVNKAFETHLAGGLELERRLFNMLFGTEDKREGMTAFIEKREASWRGQ